MNFSDIFMIHIFELLHKAEMFLGAVVFLDIIFFEIHDVFVGGLFGAVDVDEGEVGVGGGLDEVEGGGVGLLLGGGLGLAHLFVSILLLNRSVKKIILYILLRGKIGFRLFFVLGELLGKGVR